MPKMLISETFDKHRAFATMSWLFPDPRRSTLFRLLHSLIFIIHKADVASSVLCLNNLHVFIEMVYIRMDDSPL
jgi:hypothetical protein